MDANKQETKSEQEKTMTGPRLKVASTNEMHKLTAEAAGLMYNRVLSGDGLNMLDPEGNHVLVPMMVHAHARGKVTDPHMRTLAYLKTRESETPEQVVIDVAMKTWESLRFADEYLQELKAAEVKDAA